MIILGHQYLKPKTLSIIFNNGFILKYQENSRSSSIRGYIQRHSPYTEALSTTDFAPKKKEVFFISFDGESLDTICLGTRKRKVVTLKYAVEFSRFITISPPLKISQIENNLDHKVRHHFMSASSGEGGKIPLATWRNLIKYVKQERNEIAHKIDDLFQYQAEEEYQGDDKNIEIFKRDATRVALNFADIDLRRAESSFQIKDEKTELPPFLRGLENSELREDRMLIHDSKIFANWESVPVRPDITAQYRQGDKTLTIQNYNREKIEEQLGVDLLYYNHFYKSYILIQYKRLLFEGGREVFRLSERNYMKEYERMTKLQSYLDSSSNENSSSNEPNDYRIHNGLCYFKLCEKTALNYSSSEMIKGMYIPLDFWDELIKSDSTTGKSGGKLITYDNVGRYFNNTNFIELVKNGWIGSDIKQGRELEKIIIEILNSGRSLVLAEFDRGNEAY